MDNVPNARWLRHDATEAEKKLWARLRNRPLNGHKFTRQKPVGPYIVDFACFDARLIVELDGGQHTKNASADKARTDYLEQAGWFVIRFWNPEICDNPDDVLVRISAMLDIARNR
jgi:very-short-patch-repair endonuclease